MSEAAAAQQTKLPQTFILPVGANIPQEWVKADNAAELDIVVPSWGTGDKDSYIVRMLKEDRSLHCECKGYRYHGKCHHLPYLIGFTTKPHRPQGVQDMSIKSYHELLEEGAIGEGQRVVWEYLARNADQTDREVARGLGFQDPNATRPRRNELMHLGVVVEAGKRKCSVSGKTASVWRAVGGSI